MRDELIAALRACVDVLRRADPVWCEVMSVEQVTDAEWDAALARAEDAIDSAREARTA